MFWRIIAFLLLPVLSLAGAIIAAASLVAVGVAIDASNFNEQVIHEIALPSIAIAIALSTFPWQIAGKSDTDSKRFALISGQFMLTGATTSAAAYAIYWAATVLIKNQSIDKFGLANPLYYTSCVFALVGTIGWISGLCLFLLSFCAIVWSWDRTSS